MAYNNYKLGSEEALCAKTEQGSTPRANERLVARVPVAPLNEESGMILARAAKCRQSEEKGGNFARSKMGTGEMLVKASYRPIHGNVLWVDNAGLET